MKFIKALVKVDPSSGTTIESKQVFINPSNILFFQLQSPTEYELVVNQETRAYLQNTLFHRIANIKYITATVKDLSELVSA